jgi:hypothetical protein
MTANEVLSHPKCRPWTADSISKAETLRQQLGWE